MPLRKKQRMGASDSDLSHPTTSSGSHPQSIRVTRAAERRMNEQNCVLNPATSVAAAIQRPPKAVRASGTTRVVRKGRLQTLPDLCVEVILEIFGYLDSQDLLNLSRTCKEFRNFFLNRKVTNRLWEQARRNAGNLPPRPPFMSEPAFVHLLYSPHCHVCGCANVRKVLVSWFTRICSNCLPASTIWYQDARKEAASQIEDVLGEVFMTHSLQVYWSVLDFTRSPYDQKRNLLLRAHVGDIITQFKALPQPVSAEAKKVFLQKLRDDRAIRIQHAAALGQWLKGRDGARQANLEDARKQRFEAIASRLRAEGWDKELTFMGDKGIEAMSKLPVVRQSSKLTEGAWQKVFGAVQKLLHDTRRERLDRELRVVYRTRIDMLTNAIIAHYVTLPRTASMDCRPQAIDLAFMPECRAIIDVPLSETVTIDQFKAVVPKLSARWDRDVKAMLTEYIRPHLGKVARGVDPLDLAIAFFPGSESCRAYIGAMRYPFVLGHACTPDCFRRFYPNNEEKRELFDAEDTYTRTIKSLEWDEGSIKNYYRRGEVYTSIRTPFNVDCLNGAGGPSVVVSTMRAVVSAVGLDPAKATFDELEACDVWLRCLTCETYEPDSRICAYSWRSMYSHHDAHMGYMMAKWPVKWGPVDESDMVKIREAQEKAMNRPLREYHYPIWSCSLCATFNGRMESMEPHLRKRHNIDNPLKAWRDGTIYLYPSTDKAEVHATLVELRGPIYPHWQAPNGRA